MTPRRLAAALAVCGVLALAGCGKNGSPVVPGSSFPHAYPSPKLSPTETAAPAAPEDQPGMQTGDKAKFTDKGSYIDPSVKDVELGRAGVAPGSTLPYTQTSQPGSDTPFNQSLGRPGASPLDPTPGTTPPDDEQPPP